MLLMEKNQLKVLADLRISMEHFQHITCGMKNISAYLIVFHRCTRDEFSTLFIPKRVPPMLFQDPYLQGQTFLHPNHDNLPLILTQQPGPSSPVF